MTMIFGRISDYEKSQFRSKFSAYYSLDPESQNWTALRDVIDQVANKPGFYRCNMRTDIMVMLRDWARELGLRREDRGGSGQFAIEGYYGLSRLGGGTGPEPQNAPRDD
jgi:hypothetical protein